MTGLEIFGVAPWMIIAAIVAWLGRAYVYRDRKRSEDATATANVDMHRDDLAIKLLRAANEEVQQVRSEIEDVRQENKALRALEQHFYHFQQALEHLEAVLTAADEATRAVAERNATAFLSRMRRLQQAKGTIQQEIQVVESASRLDGKDQA